MGIDAIERGDLQRLAALRRAAHHVQVLLGQGEHDVDRVQLGQRDDRAGGGHHVARVDRADAGQAVNRRADLGVIELDLGIAHRGLVGRHRRLVLGHGVLLGDLVDLGHVLAVLRILRALVVAARGGKQRLVLLAPGNRLVIVGLEGARVDARQHLALLHRLPLGELDAEQPPRDLRQHRHRVERLHRAQRSQVHRHVLLDHRHHGHRHRRRVAALAIGALGRAIGGFVQHADADHGDHDHRQHDQRDLPKTRHVELLD